MKEFSLDSYLKTHRTDVPLDEKEVELRLRYLHLAKRDVDALQKVFPIIEEEIDDIVDAFYRHLLDFEETRSILQTESTVQRLKGTLKTYLRTAFSCTLDRDYFEGRFKIGQAHNNVGLRPKWYIGAYCLLKRLINPIIFKAYKGNTEKVLYTLDALDKVFFLDATLAMDSYIHSYIGNLEDAYKKVVQTEQDWIDTFNSITDLVSVHDKDFNIIKANKAVYERFGIRKDDLGRKKCYHIFHGTDKHWPDCPLVKARESLKPAVSEVDDPYMGGVFMISSFPRFNEAGEFMGVIHIAKDITEKKKLVQELEARNVDLQRINQELGTFSEKLQTVMRSARVPIATLDVERKVLSVNPAFEELTGWRMEEISGKQYDILLSLAVSRTHAFAGELEPVFIGKAVVADRGGKRVDVSYTEAPLKDYQGNIIGSVSTMEDITRELEVDRMKSEFISTVSHELRTPLTSIKGYVDLILEGDAGEVNETQKEFLQIVAQSTNRLGDLVNDLLDVERIESGRIQLRREPVDIGVIIYEVIHTFSKEIEKKGISLYTAVPKTLPMVLGDRERIEQVLANLVSNAIKYNIPSGWIKVAAGLEDNFVKVDVVDSGLGISEEDQRRLFQKFFRAGSAKTSEEGGTGLGLSIVKSIVEATGGKVRVKSKLREGSTFTILLPAEKPPREYIPEKVEEKRVVAPKRTVMIVDDEPAVVKFLELQLSKAGYNVVTVQDAQTAIKMARERHPDVITLDILMPGVDGFKVLEELKSDKSTEAIPVIILSIVEDPAKGFTLGAADYLKKPIEVPKLLNSIHNLMREVSGERGKKVLIVEDDATVRRLLIDVLGTRGIKPLEARTGEEGLELARANLPDLIILDLQLPGISGYEVIKQLKADSKTAGIPIIVLTASELGRGMPKVIALGADEYMRKPFDNRVLLSIVDKLTGRVTP
jgi:PAS domain S-box-containing protein